MLWAAQALLTGCVNKNRMFVICKQPALTDTSLETFLFSPSLTCLRVCFTFIVHLLIKLKNS